MPDWVLRVVPIKGLRRPLVYVHSTALDFEVLNKTILWKLLLSVGYSINLAIHSHKKISTFCWQLFMIFCIIVHASFIKQKMQESVS